MRTILLFFFIFVASQVEAQVTIEAIGGCTSVTITDFPSFPEVLEYQGASETVVFNVSDNVCDKFITTTYPILQPQITLNKLDSNGGSTNISTIFGPGINSEFTGLQKGKYDIFAFVPHFHEYPCNGSGPSVRHRYRDANTGNILGSKGTYLVPGPVGATSNEVLVDNTETTDIIAKLTDESGTERDVFSDTEAITLDLSMSPHYNRYRVNISQVGSSNFRTDGWENSTDSEIPLNDIWTQGGTNGWRFWNGHTFKVSVYLDNKDCKNGVWKKQEIFFSTCPSGVNCRFTQSSPNEIIVLPNPASDIFILKELEIEEAGRYHLNILDVNGRQVKSLSLLNNEVDVSDLISGLYIVQVFDNGEQLFSSKLVVE